MIYDGYSRRQQERRFLVDALAVARACLYLLCALAFVVGMARCSTTSIDFRSYRVCVENATTIQHDPGTVMWEELGDDGLRHYGVWSDRNRDDPRQVQDIAATGGVRLNRLCPLVRGMGVDDISARFPIAERTYPQ